jgi:hypothetical protein
LVLDTFDKIVIYGSGRRPRSTKNDEWDVLLLAKGGVGRVLHLNKDGTILSAYEATARHIT